MWPCSAGTAVTNVNVDLGVTGSAGTLDQVTVNGSAAANTILVGASGFSYEDAAAICGCAVGTIKSRVNRARSKLSALLYVDGAEDFGPDDTVRAVIGGNGGR